MGIYAQNIKKDKLSTTQQITTLFLEDISEFGDQNESLYLQDEAIVIKIFLTTYYLETPNITIADYLSSLLERKIPNLNTITRAIYRSMEKNLTSYKNKRKNILSKSKKIIPKQEDLEYIFKNYKLDRTNMIVQYYICFHGVSLKMRLIDFLDLTTQENIPNLKFTDIEIIRQQNKK
jgi:hypothetical protein